MALGALRTVEFDSRTSEDGKVHTVTVHTSKRAGLAGPAGTQYVNCTCTAGQFYWANLRQGKRVTGCWGMKRVRALFDVPTPRFVQRYG